MTRDEALEALSIAAAASRAMLGRGILDDEIDVVVRMLDMLDGLVRESWPAGAERRAAVGLGRYVARALEEPVYAALARQLAELDYDLTRRLPEA